MSESTKEEFPGFLTASLSANSKCSINFDLPVRLLASHPLTGQDTLTIIVYTAESIDNPFESTYTHFEGIGITSSTKFAPSDSTNENVPVINLSSAGGDVYLVSEMDGTESFRVVDGKKPARSWKKLDGKLTLVPWFARRIGVGRDM